MIALQQRKKFYDSQRDILASYRKEDQERTNAAFRRFLSETDLPVMLRLNMAQNRP